MAPPEKENILRLLEAIVAFIDEGVIVADDRGQVFYHNPAAGDLLGFPGNEPIRSMHAVLEIGSDMPLDKAIASAAKDDCTPAGATCIGTDFTKFHKQLVVDGERRDLEIHCGQTTVSLGGLRLMIIRDVTARHRLDMLVDRSRGDLVTNDRKVMGLLERVHQVAPSTASVLLQGESGTGKTHIARLIHRLSRRNNRPFVEVNCAAIPTTLIESELFGHVKGAFTGAVKDRPGRFAAANGGTLFLDEIAEVPMHLQAKLLRAIQDQEFEAVGSDKTSKVDIRIITASNVNLRDMVEDGEFRADLFYRLAVFTLHVPPIRERPGDIPLLLKHFCTKLEQRGYPEGIECSQDAMQLLMNYDWPGNVRELENAVEHAMICAVNNVVKPESLPEQIRNKPASAVKPRPSGKSVPRAGNGASLLSAKQSTRAPANSNAKREIEQALALAKGNKSLAARYLGVDRTTLWRRMQKFQVGNDTQH